MWLNLRVILIAILVMLRDEAVQRCLLPETTLL